MPNNCIETDCNSTALHCNRLCRVIRAKTMWLYCYLDSSGNIERTNLQLYSLKKAAESWNDLARVSSYPDKSEIEDFKERLVFIVNCFGLSLSQLLGQNWPSENQERIDNPDVLLSNILNCSHIEKTEQTRLNRGVS